jgi:hypothetical protein
MYLKASSIKPPLQPWLPSAWEQSISCCSEAEVRVLPAIFQAPSTEPVVENDQQLPHWPWFLTGVTAPDVRQSIEVTVVAGRAAKLRSRAGTPFLERKPLRNSSAVKSENWLTPTV